MKEKRKRRKPVDLSAVYAVDPDLGQERHGELPREILDHLAAVFAHDAGLGPDPGFYDGPAPKEYEDGDE
jgi:hypothetical protein